MKRLYTKIKCNLERDIFEFKESRYDFLQFHLGTNSIFLVLIFFVFVVISFEADVLNWNYLKGVNDELSFFIGLFATVMGVGAYRFWSLGEKSVYSLHFAKDKYIEEGVNVIFAHKGLSFGISDHVKIRADELSSTSRLIFCIGIFANLAIITLDNGEFDKLSKFPAKVLQENTDFCPDKDDELENAPPIPGCELILRVYKLGYAKDLGICEPKKIDPEKMKVCEKRRSDEPYFHYMSRLLMDSVESKISFFDNDRVKKIEDKFDLQLQQLEVLKEYQVNAINASPRASHHIWTNLPYPENIFVQKYRELLRPGYCLEKFQNQTNTTKLEEGDRRINSKLLEHVYGQLLFNPKSKITVGFCKEYNIHWDSKPDTCDRLAKNPKKILEKHNVLSDVELVLKRHDIANAILSLDEEIEKIMGVPQPKDSAESQLSDKNSAYDKLKEIKGGKKSKKIKIVKSKIAKDKQQLRKKNELVSFQCFMRENRRVKRNVVNRFTLNDTGFPVRTRYFPMTENAGEAQISMYKEFSKVLEDRFHYSRLSSRSDILIASAGEDVVQEERLLEKPSYLFSRLEKLKNVDIFLGNKWILERDDLLGVYPYHVHLQNYVKSFRVKYQENRGRL